MKAPLFLLLGLASLVSVSAADRRDFRREEPRVIVFEHAGFQGDSLVLYPGDEIDNFSGKTFEHGGKLNDSISSIIIEGGAELFVYENAGYRGQALRVTESVRDLTGRLLSGAVDVSWNDRISSLRVAEIRGYSRPGRPGPRPEPRLSPEKIEKIVFVTFQDILGRKPDPGELSDFRGRFLDQGWTEGMLRDHLHTEERYRIELADKIIKRAYLDVLGREADPGGIKTYRRNLLERKWTEGDVKDDLRKSAEYRSKHH